MATVSRDRPIDVLRGTLQETNGVDAAWEGGSAAFGSDAALSNARVPAVATAFAMFRHIVAKERLRGRAVDALAFYQSMMLRALAEALRLLHCPERRVFGLRCLTRDLDGFDGFDGIMRRSSPTGRVRAWTLRARRGVQQPLPFAVAPIASGELVRLLPGWYSDAGPLSLYDPSRRLLPAKTRVFVDFVVERFRSFGFARLVDSRPPDNHQPLVDRR